jgi:hypothetical protein
MTKIYYKRFISDEPVVLGDYDSEAFDDALKDHVDRVRSSVDVCEWNTFVNLDEDTNEIVLTKRAKNVLNPIEVAFGYLYFE